MFRISRAEKMLVCVGLIAAHHAVRGIRLSRKIYGHYSSVSVYTWGGLKIYIIPSVSIKLSTDRQPLLASFQER